ncbi:hypothetical protein K435DRAFT_807611 [Dendrothele bispora CBS 962.96]|uniref:Uncharacterized protein n=1 Tax=Dendrothele bispora (strain CBS 962.96) TaxID=1314807 RepID=A0A4S8L434_DENBC|nr:hypothetical protein K435DRAFT_807611 [Dendrothele bispora CBS 962.96]
MSFGRPSFVAIFFIRKTGWKTPENTIVGRTGRNESESIEKCLEKMDAAEFSRWPRFAAKGAATHDCVVEGNEDLMFMKCDANPNTDGVYPIPNSKRSHGVIT